jgi:hypothetical protein
MQICQFSRREDSDSVNDETFGSEGHSNEERIEQERERRGQWSCFTGY